MKAVNARSLLPSLLVLFFLVPRESPIAGGQLAPTPHAALPERPSELWLVPADDDRSAKSEALYEPLVEAAAKLAEGDFARALALASRPALTTSPLRDYAAYYKGMAELRLLKAGDARATFDALRARNPHGALATAAALGWAEAAETLGDYGAALGVYEQLAAQKTSLNEDVLSRLGRAALAAGDREKAARAFTRIYYDFPLTDAATEASSQMETLADSVEKAGYTSELGRAAALFGARRHGDARAAFSTVQREAAGDDRELVELRIAECDYFLRRYPAALDALRPWLDRGARRAEAQFFYLSALRELGRDDEYIERTRSLVAGFPDSSWSEEALNNLGTYYILANDDEKAAEVFRELYEKFPTGTRAERAAWKYGWWQYKNGEYADTIRVFEGAASAFPRSNYRPSFLYWAARAHGKVGAGEQAEARLRLVYTDYGNSYYGRLAVGRLPRAQRSAPPALAAGLQASSSATPPPPTTDLIKRLLAAGLYDDALNELRFAQRAWGTTPAIEATIAWVYQQKGDLRQAITLMRRAYPQHLTASGQDLPTEILQVIFPLTYWNLIRKHSAARGLDPYLVAALIAQESTFDPKIRSAANAWGLMQIVPATGRRLARSIGIRRFTTSMLTNPETNIRLGTLYFSRLVDQFGGTYYALASYNAGENRVVRWKAERPGLDEDEFIDDIPFPETQNYVKRILGTAEDYRALYGKGGEGRPIPVAAR